MAKGEVKPAAPAWNPTLAAAEEEAAAALGDYGYDEAVTCPSFYYYYEDYNDKKEGECIPVENLAAYRKAYYAVADDEILVDVDADDDE